jgi:hypothetical protein
MQSIKIKNSGLTILCKPRNPDLSLFSNIDDKEILKEVAKRLNQNKKNKAQSE